MADTKATYTPPTYKGITLKDIGSVVIKAGATKPKTMHEALKTLCVLHVPARLQGGTHLYVPQRPLFELLDELGIEHEEPDENPFTFYVARNTKKAAEKRKKRS